MKTGLITAGLVLAGTALLAACGSSNPARHGTTNGAAMPGTSMPGADGLQATANGYTMQPTGTAPMASIAMPVQFHIQRAGTVVTGFQPEQTKLMHLYLIRSDLTGFQHLHPSMDSAGTWTVTPTELTPGRYRMYVQFLPTGAASALVLSSPLTVPGPGASHAVPRPPAGNTASIDGYTVTPSGGPTAGAASMLTLRFARARQPVTDLQPYLDSFAHVTAIRAGSLAFAHLHPEGAPATGNGGPTLQLHAELPHPGEYRMFIQFQTGGALHTAQLTVTATR